MIDRDAYIQIQSNMLTDLGHPVRPQATVLDFGCGVGEIVTAYRKRQVQAYGCDIALSDSPEPLLQSYIADGVVRLIQLKPYQVPFPDQMFDIVVSNQVFEHVQEYEPALAEIRRVLKPDGVALHIFPARYQPIEPHVFVPLANVLRPYWWLWLWAALGIRNQFQQGMSVTETARRNWDFLKNHTFYLSQAQIEDHLKQHYRRWQFVEELFIKHSPRWQRLHPVVHRFPVLAQTASTFWSRVLATWP